MLLRKATGDLWSARKNKELSGWRSMMVDVLDQKDEKQGFLAATDNVGAGVRDKVLISQGDTTRISTEDPNVPIDAMIVGVINSTEER